MPLEQSISGQIPPQELRWQAPPEITSLSYRAQTIEIVNMANRGRPKQFTDEQARQRNKESRKRYMQREQGKRKKAEANTRYWQSEKGKAIRKSYYSTDEARAKNTANKRLQRQRERLIGQ